MSVNNKAEVAIIILNWNGYEDTIDCLKSLELLVFSNFHVFLVDNNSQDGSFERLEADLKKGKFNLKLTLIQSGENLGFAGGNNVGIKIAYKQGYKYFWLLNNDTVVDKNALGPLLDIMEKDEKVGIVGSKIYYYGTNKIWFAGGKVNPFSGVTKHIGIGEEDNGQFKRIIEVDYITGCSLFFRAELIETAGYMSEDYFLYYEETDWNLRARKVNWKIVLQPRSMVYHKISATVKKNSKTNPPYVNYYDIRNKYVMLRRNLDKHYIIFFLIVDILKKLVKIFIKERKDVKVRVKLVYKAIVDIINGRMGKLFFNE